MSLHRRFPGAQEALLALVTTACLAVLLEIGWRWAGHAPRVDPGVAPSVNTYLLVSDPRLGFRNRADGSFRNRAVAAAPLVTTDRDGFRNGLGWDPDGEEPVLVFLGDSTTFGAEVEDDRTGPSEVARRLSGRVRALNAAVRAYNTVQSLRMLERVLELHPRVRWAVYMVCGNDWRENLDPAIHYPAVAPSVRRTAEGFRSIEPSSSRPPGTPVTEAYVPRSIRLQLWGLRRSAVLNTLFVAGPPLGRPPTTRASLDELTAVFVELLGRMRRLAEGHGVTLGVTYYTRIDDESWRRTAEAAAEAGVPFLPIHDAFTREAADYAAPKANGGYDEHYGTLGTRTWAEALEPHLRKWLEEG